MPGLEQTESQSRRLWRTSRGYLGLFKGVEKQNACTYSARGARAEGESTIAALARPEFACVWGKSGRASQYRMDTLERPFLLATGGVTV